MIYVDKQLPDKNETETTFFTVSDVKRDGNCFYHCVEHLIPDYYIPLNENLTEFKNKIADRQEKRKEKKQKEWKPATFREVFHTKTYRLLQDRKTIEKGRKLEEPKTKTPEFDKKTRETMVRIYNTCSEVCEEMKVQIATSNKLLDGIKTDGIYAETWDVFLASLLFQKNLHCYQMVGGKFVETTVGILESMAEQTQENKWLTEQRKAWEDIHLLYEIHTPTGGEVGSEGHYLCLKTTKHISEEKVQTFKDLSESQLKKYLRTAIGTNDKQESSKHETNSTSAENTAISTAWQTFDIDSDSTSKSIAIDPENTENVSEQTNKPDNTEDTSETQTENQKTAMTPATQSPNIETDSTSLVDETIHPNKPQTVPTRNQELQITEQPKKRRRVQTDHYMPQLFSSPTTPKKKKVAVAHLHNNTTSTTTAHQVSGGQPVIDSGTIENDTEGPINNPGNKTMTTERNNTIQNPTITNYKSNTPANETRCGKNWWTLIQNDFPTTDTCKWTIDRKSRVLLSKFSVEEPIHEEDKNFLLKMMERTDIAVVCEGLIQKDWSFNIKHLEMVSRQDSYMICRIMKKRVLYDQENWEDCWSEDQQGTSIKLCDYVKYLNLWNEISTREVIKEVFHFTSGDGMQHEVNMDTTIIYLLDLELPTYLPKQDATFKQSFRLPEVLPGGENCMMHAVRYVNILCTNSYFDL